MTTMRLQLLLVKLVVWLGLGATMASAQPLFPDLECLLRMEPWNLLFMDLYEWAYREDSVMTLAQAGNYYGPEGIREYVDFAQSRGSPYVQSGPTYEVIPRIRFRWDAPKQNCEYIMYFDSHFEMDPALSTGAQFDVLWMIKYVFSWEKRYITNANVFYPNGFLGTFFGDFLNTDQTRQFVCDVIEGPCADIIGGIGGDCMTMLNDLPIAEEGTLSVDGKTQGCRALHATFAAENLGHCAHISFEPMLDPNDKIKCQTPELINPEDLFRPEEFDTLSAFGQSRGYDATGINVWAAPKEDGTDGGR